MIGLRTGLATGLRTGLALGIGADEIVQPSSGAPAWSVDATSGIALPATLAEWNAFIAAKGLSISAPTNVWLDQDASSPLVDALGAGNLVASGTPSYQQAVTGWSAKAFVPRDGQADRATIGVDVSAASQLVLDIASFPANPAINRVVMGISPTGATTDGIYVGHTTGGSILVRDLANSTNGVGSYSSGVHPLVQKYDVTHSACVVYTDQEAVTPTFSAIGAGTRQLGLGSTGTSASAAGHVYTARWTGAAAEVSAANVKALLQAMGFSVTGY